MYVNSKEARKKLNVSAQTLRRWANAGKIKYNTTEGGHRRYLIEEKKEEIKREKIIYGRVSSKKQEGELNNQIEFLKSKYPDYKLISDIGSGINFKRYGFKTILEGVVKGNIGEVVVSYSDRFSRFGFELFQWLFELHGATLKSINTEEDDRTPEQELSEDLMSIVTVFSSRYYGRRNYNKLLSENSDISE